MQPGQHSEARNQEQGSWTKLQDENLAVFIFAVFTVLLAIFACLTCVLQSDDAGIDTIVSMVKRTKRELQSFDCENGIKEFKDAHIKDGKFQDVPLNQSRTKHENNVRNQSELLVNHLRQTITDRFGHR